MAWVQTNRSRDATLSSNSLRQTVHTHPASLHQAAKLVAALLRVARVPAGLAESNDRLAAYRWVYDSRHLQALTLLVVRQEGPVKKLSGGVLAWLSVWSEVQTCVWPS